MDAINVWMSLMDVINGRHKWTSLMDGINWMALMDGINGNGRHSIIDSINRRHLWMALMDTINGWH